MCIEKRHHFFCKADNEKKKKKKTVGPPVSPINPIVKLSIIGLGGGFGVLIEVSLRGVADPGRYGSDPDPNYKKIQIRIQIKILIRNNPI